MRAFQQPWVRMMTAVVTMGLLIALLSIGLAACGYSSATAASTMPQVQTKVKNCGSVTSLGRLVAPENGSGAAAAVKCFLQAFRTCQPATLVYSQGGVDTILTRTFTIHNNHGKCSIMDARQFRVVPRPASPAQIFTCAGLTKLPKGLRINACGKDGNVVVPGA